jgi:hypothetical protein
MYTATFIRRHIFQLPPGRIFATRHLLPYGSRAAVDQALSRLVKAGVIIRLARGIFVRQEPGAGLPSVPAVVAAKAEAFGKQIATGGAELARQFGLAAGTRPGLTFCVNGSSSSFVCGEVVVRLERTCQRRMNLGEGPTGRALAALWHVGREAAGPAEVELLTRCWGRRERQEMRQQRRWLPDWISSCFACRKPRPAAIK